MKTQINRTDLQAELQSTFETESQKVLLNAEADGKRNYPTIRDNAEHWFREHHLAYDKLIAVIFSRLQMASKCLHVMETGQLFKEAHLELDTRERLVKGRLIHSSQALKGMTASSAKRWPYLAGVLALGLFDGVFNEGFISYQLRLPEIVSYLLSLVVGFGFFVVAHWLVPMTRTAKGVALQKYGVWLVTGGMAVIFYFMAVGRQLASGVSTPSFITSIQYALFSLFLFAVACLLSRKYHEKNQGVVLHTSARYDTLKKEEKALNAELKEIKMKREKLHTQEQEERETARAVFEYATGLRRQVMDEAHQSYCAYIKVNRLSRSDGEVPESMQSTDYPFAFSSFFDLGSEQPPFQAPSYLISVFLVVMLIVTSCTGGHNKTVIDAPLSLFIDQTDSFQVYPDSTQVLHILDLDKHSYDPAQVMITTITDTDVNTRMTYTLPAGNRLMGNLYSRTEDISVFKHDVFEQLEELHPKGGVKPLGHSCIYRPLANHLISLKEAGVEHPIIAVYSDFHENSTIANFHDPQTLRNLQQHPADMEQHFEEAVPLPDLQGVTLYFVYQPKDFEDNNRYAVASGFFKRLFEKHSVKVYLVASL